MQSSFPYIFSHRALYARLLSAFYVLFLFVPRTVYGTFSGWNRLRAFGCMDITFHSLHQCWLPLFLKCSTNRMEHFLFFAGSGDSCFQGCVSSPVFPGEKLYFAVCNADICNHFTKAEDQNCCDFANSFWILSFSWDGTLGACPAVTSKQSQTYGFDMQRLCFLWCLLSDCVLAVGVL